MRDRRQRWRGVAAVGQGVKRRLSRYPGLFREVEIRPQQRDAVVVDLSLLVATMQHELQIGGETRYRSAVDAAFGKRLPDVCGERRLVQRYRQDFYRVTRVVATSRYWYAGVVVGGDEPESLTGENRSHVLVGHTVVTDY